MIIDSGIVTGSLQVSGSFSVQGTTTLQGALNVTGGITGSVSGSATTEDSASFSTRITSLENWSSSLDATYATDAQLNASASALQAGVTASINVLSSSVAPQIASLQAWSSSLDSGYVTNAELNASSSALQAGVTSSIGVATASLLVAITSSAQQTYSELQAGVTASIAGFATTGSNTFTGTNNFGIVSASYIYALSASIDYLSVVYQTSSVVYSSGSNTLGDAPSDVQTLYGTVDIKNGPVLVTGSVNVANTLTTATSSIGILAAGVVTASVFYGSGSSHFGNLPTDSNTFYGIVDIKNGPVLVTGSMNVGGRITAGELQVSYGITGSLFGTASYIEVAQTASLALLAELATSASQATNANTAISSSYALSAQNAYTASFVGLAQTASFVQQAQNAYTASYAGFAATASFVQQAQNAYSASHAIFAQNASTASYVQIAQTASFVLQAQNAISASYAGQTTLALTASYVELARSASYVLDAQNAYSASTALLANTASYVLQSQNTISASYAGTATNAYTASSADNNFVARGIVGIGGPANGLYQVYVTSSISDGTLGLDTSGDVNAMYFLKGGLKKFEISTQGGDTPITQIVPYTSSGIFRIGNPSNASTDYILLSEPTGGRVILGPGIGTTTQALSGSQQTDLVQFTGNTFVSGALTTLGVQYSYGPVLGYNGFTGSLQGNAQTATTAISAPYYVLTASYSSDSSSFSTRTTNLESTASTLTSASASFSVRTANLESTASTLTSASASFVANYVQNSQTSSMTVLSASYAGTASYALNVNPDATASYAINALNASTASYVVTALTASYVVTALTASYVTNAQTASYVNPLVQDVQITGNLTSSANILANKFVFTDGVVNTNNNGQLMFAAGGNYMYLYTGINGLYINNQANNANNVIISDAGTVQTRGALTVGAPGNNQNIIFGGSDAKLDWAGTGAQIFYSAGALQFSSVGATNNMILQSGGGAIFNSGITGSLQATNGVISSSLQLAGAGFATTASNTFTGAQYISNTTDATSFTDTPALYTDGGFRVTKNAYVSGGLYIAGNLTVYGTSSVNYVTSSTLLGLEYINLNTDLPALRYAGINVGDSGSEAGISSSFWYDSEKDNWLYVHAHQGSSQTSSLAINGPIAYNNLGNEQGLTANYITKAQLVTVDNNHHITSSQIYDDGTTVAIAGNLKVTGSLYAGNLTGSLNGSNLVDGTVTNAKLTNSAITIAGTSTSLGGSISAATILSGTGVFSGSAQIPNTSITNAQLVNSAVTITAGTGLSGGGSVSLGGSVTITNAGVTSFNTRTGAVTLAATDVSGLGAGIFSGSAQIPAASITNAQLANSTISGVALGSNLATLTIGTGLSGTSYNGSGAVTIANTGVTSNVAGTGISVSGATGAVTITNSGVTSAVAGTGVSVSGATGAVTISIGQAVATSSNVQFNSLGVGTAGSAVAGEIRATADITAYYSSDERLKEDITPIENPIEKLMAIDGVTFNWKEGFEVIHSHTGADTGVIAQQVKTLELPGTVTTRETGYMAVNYEKLNALLIEGFKAQQLEINALKLELQEIKAKLK